MAHLRSANAYGSIFVYRDWTPPEPDDANLFVDL